MPERFYDRLEMAVYVGKTRVGTVVTEMTLDCDKVASSVRAEVVAGEMRCGVQFSGAEMHQMIREEFARKRQDLQETLRKDEKDGDGPPIPGVDGHFRMVLL